MQKRAETTALCSKIRGIRQKPKPSKNEQNSQYFEIKLDTQNFLHNIRQSLVYCQGMKLISTRLKLASTHIEAIIGGVVRYLYEFHCLVFLHIKCRNKIRCKKLIFLTLNRKMEGNVQNVIRDEVQLRENFIAISSKGENISRTENYHENSCLAESHHTASFVNGAAQTEYCSTV